MEKVEVAHAHALALVVAPSRKKRISCLVSELVSNKIRVAILATLYHLN